MYIKYYINSNNIFVSLNIIIKTYLLITIYKIRKEGVFIVPR